MSEGERGREKRYCVEYIKEQGVREEEREGKRNRGRGSRKEDESKKDFELDSRHWSNRERLYITHKVTPVAQMSALNPDQESWPEAISGGWKAGLPWQVLHRSLRSYILNSCGREHSMCYQALFVHVCMKISSRPSTQHFSAGNTHPTFVCVYNHCVQHQHT